MKKIIELLTFILILSVACEESSNPFNTNTYLLKPTVGVYPENHFGITSVGYGQLNPRKPSTVIAFSTPENMEVTIWVVPITTGDDESSGFTNTGGGTIVEIESAKAVFFLNDIFEAGHHTIEWNVQDENGTYIPGGWYRLYLSAEEIFDYRDMFLWYSEYDR